MPKKQLLDTAFNVRGNSGEIMLYGYGEDALTLKMLTDNIWELLQLLGEPENIELQDVVRYYRPSFGRRSGSGRSEFGEFDFILFTPRKIYLGESKWDGGQSRIELEPRQINRHKVMREYFNELWDSDSVDWERFRKYISKNDQLRRLNKSFPRPGTILYHTLTSVLEDAFDFYKKTHKRIPKICDVLLYFYDSTRNPSVTITVPDEFCLVSIDRSKMSRGTLITLGPASNVDEVSAKEAYRLLSHNRTV
jgi:hypothetical protein